MRLRLESRRLTVNKLNVALDMGQRELVNALASRGESDLLIVNSEGKYEYSKGYAEVMSATEAEREMIRSFGTHRVLDFFRNFPDMLPGMAVTRFTTLKSGDDEGYGKRSTERRAEEIAYNNTVSTDPEYRNAAMMVADPRRYEVAMTKHNSLFRGLPVENQTLKQMRTAVSAKRWRYCINTWLWAFRIKVIDYEDALDIARHIVKAGEENNGLWMDFAWRMSQDGVARTAVDSIKDAQLFRQMFGQSVGKPNVYQKVYNDLRWLEGVVMGRVRHGGVREWKEIDTVEWKDTTLGEAKSGEYYQHGGLDPDLVTAIVEHVMKKKFT